MVVQMKKKKNQICNENSVFLDIKVNFEKTRKTGFFSVGFLVNFGLRLGCGYKIFGCG
jgi:hypothetical protein